MRMTEREQWEELAFFELANGDLGDPFQDGWDKPDDEDLKDENSNDFGDEQQE
jgi:hypothetical protein